MVVGGGDVGDSGGAGGDVSILVVIPELTVPCLIDLRKKMDVGKKIIFL